MKVSLPLNYPCFMPLVVHTHNPTSTLSNKNSIYQVPYLLQPLIFYASCKNVTDVISVLHSLKVEATKKCYERDGSNKLYNENTLCFTWKGGKMQNSLIKQYHQQRKQTFNISHHKHPYHTFNIYRKEDYKHQHM